uniref:Putative secreted protein n=1 Tax=Ixodes ricinus TaxID=34613 RepID=V5IH44_IXORI
MKIFIIVLLVAVLFYDGSADTKVCPPGRNNPKACNNWNKRNTSCDEGTCYSPKPPTCEECKCYRDDDDDCEVQCVCERRTTLPDDLKKTCRDPSELVPKRPLLDLQYALE